MSGKITITDAKLIREAYAEKKRVEREFSMAALARKFDVCPNTIYQIVHNKTHKKAA